jgi:hypothetical protein
MMSQNVECIAKVMKYDVNDSEVDIIQQFPVYYVQKFNKFIQLPKTKN